MAGVFGQVLRQAAGSRKETGIDFVARGMKISGMLKLSRHRPTCVYDVEYSHRSCGMFEALVTWRLPGDCLRFKGSRLPGLTVHAYSAETGCASSDEVYSCPPMLRLRCAEGIGRAVGLVRRNLAGKPAAGSRPSKIGTASTEGVPGSVLGPLSVYHTRGSSLPSAHDVRN